MVTSLNLLVSAGVVCVCVGVPAIIVAAESTYVIAWTVAAFTIAVMTEYHHIKIDVSICLSLVSRGGDNDKLLR